MKLPTHRVIPGRQCFAFTRTAVRLHRHEKFCRWHSFKRVWVSCFGWHRSWNHHRRDKQRPCLWKRVEDVGYYHLKNLFGELNCVEYIFIFWNVLNSLPFKILYNISCSISYTPSASFFSLLSFVLQNNRYFEDPRREAGGMSSGGSRSPGTISSTSRQRSESGMSGAWLGLCYLLFC